MNSGGSAQVSCSQNSAAQQVFQHEQPDDPALFENRHLADLFGQILKGFQGFDREELGMHRFGVREHHRTRGRIELIAMVQNEPTKVAIADQAQKSVVGINDTRRPGSGLSDDAHDLGEGGFDRDQREVWTRPHDVADGQEQPFSQSPAGVELGIVFFAKSASLHHAHRKSVRDREHHGCAGGRREVIRAGLSIDRNVQGHLGEPARGTLRSPGDENRPSPQGLDRGKEPNQLIGLTRVAVHQHTVFGGEHPEVAMEGLTGMQKEAGGAGAAQRPGGLSGDVAGFSQSAAGHSPAGLQNPFDGLVKGGIEPVGQGANGFSLFEEDPLQARSKTIHEPRSGKIRLPKRLATHSEPVMAVTLFWSMEGLTSTRSSPTS